MPGQWLQPHVSSCPHHTSCLHHTYAQCKVGDMLLGWRPGIVRCVFRRWKVVFLIESRTREDIVVPWAFQEFPSFSPFFFFWLSIRLSKFSAIAVLVKPLGFSGIRRWAVEDIFATLLEVLIRSKKSRVLQPCLSQSGLGPGLSGQAWLFHTWDSWPPGCD